MSSLVRIVIFENYAVHCLVEFDSNEAAAFIMERLQVTKAILILYLK